MLPGLEEGKNFQSGQDPETGHILGFKARNESGINFPEFVYADQIGDEMGGDMGNERLWIIELQKKLTEQIPGVNFKKCFELEKEYEQYYLQ